MKIDPRTLHEINGIGCKLTSYDARGVVDFIDARIAFVTERTVVAVRARAPSTGKPATVRYGDALLMWNENGRPKGLTIAAGKDAGVSIEIDIDGRKIMQPFTGAAMLTARERLLARQTRGHQLSQDQERALDGIQGVLDVILADPDPARFDAAVIGNAFVAAMTDAVGAISMPVTPEEFARKARADLLRAQISRLDPDHVDGFAAFRPLDMILEEIGVGDALSGVGLDIRAGTGQGTSEQALRREILSSDKLRNEVFGRLTTTPAMRISAVSLQQEDYDALVASLASRRLSGEWIMSAERQIELIRGEAMSGYSCTVVAFATEGRDILAVNEDIGPGRSRACVYSWPTADRAPLGALDGRMLLHVSPEEIPDETEIADLARVLDLLRYAGTIEADFELEGVTIQGRGPRRQ